MIQKPVGGGGLRKIMLGIIVLSTSGLTYGTINIPCSLCDLRMESWKICVTLSV